MAARPWQWSLQRSTVAALLAVGKTIPEAVAAVQADGLSLTTRTVENWMKRPEFLDRVEAHRATLAREVAEKAIAGSVAERATRLAYLDRLASGMGQVITRRSILHAADKEAVAGVETGLVEAVTQRQYDKDGNQIGEQVFGRFDHRLVGSMVSVLREAAVQAGDVMDDGPTIQTIVNLEVGPEGARIGKRHEQNENETGND